MGWYQVTKTINGRKYLYLQMTYREGRKVRTKNKYLGPAHTGFGCGAPANVPTASPLPGKLRAKHNPSGGLKVAKIRRLKPKPRAVMWREANKWRLEEQAHYNSLWMKQARKSRDHEAVAELQEAQRELRALHKSAFGSRLKLTKKGRRIIVARGK